MHSPDWHSSCLWALGPWGCEESYGALPSSVLPPTLQTCSGGQPGLSLGVRARPESRAPALDRAAPPMNRALEQGGSPRWVERW